MQKPFWSVTVITLFPEAFPGTLGISLLGKALNDGLWSLDVVNLKDVAPRIDSPPYGGGSGMVIGAPMLEKCLDKLHNSGSKIYYMSPRGNTFNQKKAEEIINHKNVSFICGRYEGIDARVIDRYNIEEISVGDYVLMGGEVAALSVIEASARLIPGVVGDEKSIENDSFSNGLLEHFHYTKPYSWNNIKVPEVLLSGNHEKINSWRLLNSCEITRRNRHDLWDKYVACRLKYFSMK